MIMIIIIIITIIIITIIESALCMGGFLCSVCRQFIMSLTSSSPLVWAVYLCCSNTSVWE